MIFEPEVFSEGAQPSNSADSGPAVLEKAMVIFIVNRKQRENVACLRYSKLP